MKFKNYDEALDFIEKNINEDDYLICETYANYKYGLKAPIVIFMYDYPDLDELGELHNVLNIHTTDEGILDCNSDRFFLIEKELYPDIEPYWICNGDEIYNEKDLLEDKELAELAKEELKELDKRKPELEEEIKILLLPTDPNDEKNIFIELRAGAGGDEAAIFVGDLFGTYMRFA